MSDQQATPPVTTRAAVFRTILSGINAGELPVPKGIRFTDGTVQVDVDSAADLDLWTEYFEFATDGYHYRSGQPYPDLVDPANSDRWLASDTRTWNGWMFTIAANDPITDEHRQQWIDSGSAARHAARKAGEQA